MLCCWVCSFYEVVVTISLMGKMSGCHCMSHAMPQNIQQHTTVIVTITYDRPNSLCLPRLNNMLDTKQPIKPIRRNNTVPTQKGADELA